MRLYNFLTLQFGKLIVKVLQLLHKGAGNLPGLILLGINKNILGYFKVDCPIIAVTGTNGKTSVTNFVNHLFEQSGKNVITNKLGNNLDTGIVSLFLKLCSPTGKIHADYLVLEIDESHVPVIFKKLKLETLIVLNFFRDQLDRNGEVETLILKVKSFLETFQGNVILNADDPNVARLGQANPENKNVKYFSVDKYKYATDKIHEVGEGKFCPICGGALEYEYYQYSHIGRFKCPKCGFGDNEIYLKVENVDLENRHFTVDGREYNINNQSIYYVYNMAAVCAAAKLYDIDDDILRDTLDTFEVNNGRMEKFSIGKSNAVINLAKNPVGANMTIRVMNETNCEKELMFVLNDNLADGYDVSWIWDINFEVFKDVTRVITSGRRAYDIAIRIKTSGYDPSRIEVYPDLDEAVENLFSTGGEKFIIANYTSVQPTRTAVINYIEKNQREK